jgi:hypothetical protein
MVADATVAAEAGKRNLDAGAERKLVSGWVEETYADAKKYGVNVGDATPETLFEPIWAGAKSILARRFYIKE